MPSRRHSTLLAACMALACTLPLAGCGGIDGVQFEGKIFDWLGVNSSQKSSDPKMAERAPLVVPPDVNRLPEPGSGQNAWNDLAALKDPELRKQAAAKERERLHLAYCRGEIQWKEKVFSSQDKGVYRSPYGPCPGLFSGALDKATK
jgi:hypothetical protein